MRLAVVIIAEVMAAGFQLRCFCFIREAMPAMCGVAMLVPDNSAKDCPAIKYRRAQAWLICY